LTVTTNDPGPWRVSAYLSDNVSIPTKESISVPPIISFLFLLAAFLCFLVAAFGGRVATRVNLIGLGLALYVFPLLVDAFPH
jgi:hypothetical protein